MMNSGHIDVTCSIQACKPAASPVTMIHQASSCRHGWRGRRVRHVRLGSLLRLRVRLSGIVGLVVRCLEELKCCPRRWLPARAHKLSHAGQCHRPGPAVRENSFYAEAIADCLEFIKRSYLPGQDGHRNVS